MRSRKKLGLSLAAVNLTGLLVGFSFTLLESLFAGLIGFIIGLLGSSALIYSKEQN